MNIAKSLRKPILKSICEQMFLQVLATFSGEETTNNPSTTKKRKITGKIRIKKKYYWSSGRNIWTKKELFKEIEVNCLEILSPRRMI